MNFPLDKANFHLSPNERTGLEAVVASAMAAARSAQSQWAETTLARRLTCIREFRRLVAESAGPLAEASAAARNRPAQEALAAEVLPLAEACRFIERESTTLLAPRRLGRRGLPLWLAGIRTEIHREPFGVVLVIGPGNYPLFLPGVQVIQALAAGNGVVLKPGTGGTPVARIFIELLHRAGFDRRLVALLPESTEAACAAIKARPDKVLFTGSASTGERILAQLAPYLIPATMELSGSDAVLVRADADLDLVIKALCFGLTLNAGATCVAPKRVFVHRSIATELEGRLSEVFNDARMSCHHPPSNRVASRKDLDRLRLLFAEAVGDGAHFIADGFHSRAPVPTPVVLGGVHPDSRLLDEDVFAPVLSLVTIADDAEAVARANDCPYALGASIFTRDESVARALAGRLNAGVITINDLIVPGADARIPFGGRKRSGFGVTRGAEGLLELTCAKVVTVSRGTFRPAFEPPHADDGAIFQAYLEFAHSRGLSRRVRALLALGKRLAVRARQAATRIT